MATTTFYRKANVSSAEATASLFKRFPNAELVSFETRTASAEEAASAGVKQGDLVYAATVRVAEFPPAGDGGDDSSEDKKDDSAPSEDSAPAPESDSDSSDDKSDSDSPAPSSDSEGDDKGGDFGGDGSEGDEHGAHPHKMKPEEEMVHLLQQILHAVQGGGGLGAPAGPDAGMGGPGDLDLPDVGAPDHGEALPPPAGPGGPGHPAPPLPPPVKEKSPVGVGAFAHVAGRSEIHMVRADAGEVNNRQIIAEAAEHAPTHRVAKIQRTGSAIVNGQEIKLTDHGIAVVTLVSK